MATVALAMPHQVGQWGRGAERDPCLQGAGNRAQSASHSSAQSPAESRREPMGAPLQGGDLLASRMMTWLLPGQGAKFSAAWWSPSDPILGFTIGFQQSRGWKYRAPIVVSIASSDERDEVGYNVCSSQHAQSWGIITQSPGMWLGA